MTLVEILLVLAIIATLAGLIFAAFGPARESARQRICVSNLHQIGLALSLYIADYEGTDPIPGVRMSHSQLGFPGGHSHTVDVVYQTYIKSRDVMFCPSYHGASSLAGLGSTYWWPVYVTEEAAPELDLPGIVARRGAEYVLVACDQHNTFLDFQNQPRSVMKRVVVLRLSQQVQSKLVPAVLLPSLEW